MKDGSQVLKWMMNISRWDGRYVGVLLLYIVVASSCYTGGDIVVVVIVAGFIIMYYVIRLCVWLIVGHSRWVGFHGYGVRSDRDTVMDCLLSLSLLLSSLVLVSVRVVGVIGSFGCLL